MVVHFRSLFYCKPGLSNGEIQYEFSGTLRGFNNIDVDERKAEKKLKSTIDELSILL